MRKLVIASAAAVVLSAGAAMALNANDVINANPDLFGPSSGNTVTQTVSGLFGIKIEGVDAMGNAFEYKFRNDGTMKKSETVVNGVQTETSYDANGNVSSTDSSAQDDNGSDNLSSDSHDDSNDDATDDSSDDSSSSDHESSDHESSDSGGSSGSDD